MERIREEEKKLMYISENYNENDPSYIEAKARVEFEMKCLREEAEDILRKEVIEAKKYYLWQMIILDSILKILSFIESKLEVKIG